MDPVRYISGFSRLGKRVSGLSRIRSLLDALGRPQEGLRFIHIAGTNGKGSMAQMFSEILTSAGYRTGLFTSPYILTFYDRIRINGENIQSEELSGVLKDISPVIEAHPLRDSFSQFEITQAAAFEWFRRQRCDAVVLEAGLGGLLDSTNVIESPLVSVIGSIGLDHTAVLGDTVEKIAFQKAGIIKPGRPCVLSAGAPPEAVRVFREQAEEKGSPLYIPDTGLCKVIHTGFGGSVFIYRDEVYRTAMPGLHQVNNALSVIEAMGTLAGELPVSREDIEKGIAKARIPGRVEIISVSPLTVLDGSHNPDGMKALSAFLGTLDGRTVRAVIGMHTDKDAGEAVRMLVPRVTEFYPVSGFSDRDIPAGELAGIISKAGGKALLRDGEIISLVSALSEEFPGDVLLICGSLYLVSYIKTAKNQQ